jgi:hypothetical protein
LGGRGNGGLSIVRLGEDEKPLAPAVVIRAANDAKAIAQAAHIRGDMAAELRDGDFRLIKRFPPGLEREIESASNR